MIAVLIGADAVINTATYGGCSVCMIIQAAAKALVIGKAIPLPIIMKVSLAAEDGDVFRALGQQQRITMILSIIIRSVQAEFTAIVVQINIGRCFIAFTVTSRGRY